MAFAGISYVGVVIAAIGGFLFGGIWYGVLGKAWMAALGKTDAEIKARRVAVAPMIVTFVAMLVMAWMLAGLIGHVGAGELSVRNGMISGGCAWLGFVVTTLVANHAFQGQKRMLTVIDGGHWLGVLLVEGATIGAVGM
jgi:hypothetical protein